MHEKAITIVTTSLASSTTSLEQDVRPKDAASEDASYSSPNRQAKLILIGQMFVVFAISLDMTILTTTIPTVAQALHANAIQASWIVASYLLANAVVQPLMASLADIFGRRAIIFAAMVFFTVGSIICATAHSVTTMLVGRTIQGIGGGGILSVNLIVMSDIFELRERPKYIGLQQLFVTVGFNIAPIIGGVLVKVTTWRWLFYINLPFCGIGLAVIPLLLRYERPKSTIHQKLSSVDWIGSISFIVGMTCFLLGITWAGNQFAWRSAATLVPLIVGPVIIVLTGLYERYLAKNTFLRFSLFTSWSAVAVYACAVLQSFTLLSEFYFVVLWFLSVKLYSPLQAGVYCLSFVMVCIPVSAVTGAVITRFGSYRWAVLSGWTINTISIGLLTLLGPNLPTASWIFILLIGGIGQGLLFIAHSVASQAACDQKDAAHAMGMYSFARSLGLCLGVAIGGTIFQNLLRQRLTSLDLPAEIARNAEAYAYIMRSMSDDATRASIVAAYSWALRMLFATMCGISGVALVTSCFIAEATLDQKLQTTHKIKACRSSPGREIADQA